MKAPKNRIIKATREGAPEHSEARDPQSEIQPMITVRVVGQAVGENGNCYLKGQTFETTPARARALGSLVIPHS